LSSGSELIDEVLDVGPQLCRFGGVLGAEFLQLDDLPAQADLGVWRLPARPDRHVEVVLEVQVALGESVAGYAGFLGSGCDSARLSEGGGAEHGVDGVLVTVQPGRAQPSGGELGERPGDRLDPQPRQRPLQRGVIDPGVDRLDEHRGGRDDGQVCVAGVR
jgi:hypothetical protein